MTRKTGGFICTINPPFFRLEKSGSSNSDFFSGSRSGSANSDFFFLVGDPKKRWVYTIKPPFFRLEKSGSANLDFFLGLQPSLQNHFSRTTFLENWLQIKRLKF